MLSAVSLAATDEQTITLERRFVYGRGTVETLATLDENVTLLIEERVGETTRIIPIVTNAGQRRLKALVEDAASSRPLMSR